MPRTSPTCVEAVDLDGDGHDEIVLRNEHVAAVIAPRRGGRLLSLSVEPPPSTLEASHPGALVDVGHEDDRWEVVAARPCAGGGVEAVLGHVQGGCPLYGSLKIYRLGAGARHLEVDYRLATGTGDGTRRITLRLGVDDANGGEIDLRCTDRPFTQPGVSQTSSPVTRTVSP